ncbi:MAG TPA: DUF6134 family protein [Gammaproteobacteria bacterium]
MHHYHNKSRYPLLCLSLLSLLVFSGSASTASTADKNSWQFDVFLDDSKIGYHYFSRETIDGTVHISSEAEFNVRFMFFTVYHYRHSNQEQWRDGCLIKLQSRTDDNGDQLFVKLNRDRHQTHIETVKSKTESNECIRSFSYWNLSQLEPSPLLNSQTGQLMDVSLRKLGKDTLPGQQAGIETNRYQLVGKDIEIDLWYTQDNQWLALQSTTENGSRIRYQLKSSTPQTPLNSLPQQDREQDQ